jgi:opacity protein-like surface antigen
MDPQPAPPEADASKTKKKKSTSVEKRLKGRNTDGRGVAIGYKHTYTEIDTVVTSRTQIESNGTTTITDVPLTDAEKERFPTSMHLDTFIFRYGFTDFFEVFGEVGVSYDDSISDAGLAWGGGLRLNLFQTRASGNNPAFYGALQGEYYSGEFEKEFTSAQGNKFRRETEWQEATARAEIGLNHPRFNLYGGGTYFYYREDTDRQQLNNLPPGVSSLTLKDQLEPQNEFGAYGGVSFFFTPKFLINIEGRAIDMTAISGSLEYRF